MSWVKFTPSHVVLHPVGHPTWRQISQTLSFSTCSSSRTEPEQLFLGKLDLQFQPSLGIRKKMNSSWLELADPDFCDHHDGGTLLHLRRGRRTLVLEICLNHNFSSTHSSGLPRVWWFHLILTEIQTRGDRTWMSLFKFRGTLNVLRSGEHSALRQVKKAPDPARKCLLARVLNLWPQELALLYSAKLVFEGWQETRVGGWWEQRILEAQSSPHSSDSWLELCNDKTIILTTQVRNN